MLERIDWRGGERRQIKTKGYEILMSLIPACLRMPLAVCRETIFESTGNFRPLMGLRHIS